MIFVNTQLILMGQILFNMVSLKSIIIKES